MDAKEKRQLKWTLALGIALLPPIWAVLSGAAGHHYRSSCTDLCGRLCGEREQDKRRS